MIRQEKRLRSISSSSIRSPRCLPVAQVVMKDGRVAYEHGYGMADLDHDVKITPTTIFHVGSISKQFTAAAVLMLARDGKLSLDEPVRKYVPELPDFGVPITLRHLLHHTSGLRDQWELPAAWKALVAGTQRHAMGRSRWIWRSQICTRSRNREPFRIPDFPVEFDFGRSSRARRSRLRQRDPTAHLQISIGRLNTRQPRQVRRVYRYLSQRRTRNSLLRSLRE